MKLDKAILELKKDPEFARAYQERAPEFELARAIIRRRLDLGLTQAQLAAQAGTKQANISRLENAAGNPSFSLLQRVTRALHTQLVVTLAAAPSDDETIAAPAAEPQETQDYSGEFTMRVPRSLHRDLVRAAERDGVSLNQFALAALARAVGPAVTRSVAHAAPRVHVAAEEEPGYGDKAESHREGTRQEDT